MPAPGGNVHVDARWNGIQAPYDDPSVLNAMSETPDRSSTAVSVTGTVSSFVADRPSARTIETAGGVGSGTVCTVRR